MYVSWAMRPRRSGYWALENIILDYYCCSSWSLCLWMDASYRLIISRSMGIKGTAATVITVCRMSFLWLVLFTFFDYSGSGGPTHKRGTYVTGSKRSTRTRMEWLRNRNLSTTIVVCSVNLFFFLPPLVASTIYWLHLLVEYGIP